MTKTLFWFHDKALSHAALSAISSDSRAIYIWDDTYFKTRGYSLKRLVFIYETLCEMDIEIIKGDTQKVLRTLAPDRVKTFQTADSVINQMIIKIQNDIDVDIVHHPAFVKNLDMSDHRRFFKYWNKASKQAFLINGGID